ncbi:MAG: APC family permease [Pseudomonadota bacterium]
MTLEVKNQMHYKAMGYGPNDSFIAKGENHGLKKNTLSAISIIFFIIAAASPLTGVIAIVPIMISLGNGSASSWDFLLTAAVLLIFAVGYIAMSKKITNAGALYSFVTAGLGRSVGLGTATLTIFAYTSIQAGLYGGFGYYAHALFPTIMGFSIPWWLYALAAVICCLALALHGVHSGAMVLGFLLVLETVMLIILGGGIISAHSHSHVTSPLLQLPSLSEVFSPGLGTGIMFACATFIGFEGGAIYSEEAKDPTKTISRATYSSVIFMAIIYFVVAWLITGALGYQEAPRIANEQSGNLIFYVANKVLGPSSTLFFNIFIITSLFAAIVTFHNNIARYFYTLGRQGLVWKALGYTRKKKQTPYIASFVQSAIAILFILAFTFLKLDPYNTLFAWMTGAGTIAIVLAQTLSAVAIFFYFRKDKSDRRVWHTIIAPVLAIVGLCCFLYLTVTSTKLLLGVGDAGSIIFNLAILCFFVLGVVYSLYLKKNAPLKYSKLNNLVVD